MRCPQCRSETKVVESRYRSYGKYRRRHCDQCGHLFSTKEEPFSWARELTRSTEEALKGYGK